MAEKEQKAIRDKCEEISALLIKKNISYGNSAFKPINIFGNLTAEQGLYCRINDKLSRISNNLTYESEGMADAIQDCVGYMILLLILMEQNNI